MKRRQPLVDEGCAVTVQGCQSPPHGTPRRHRRLRHVQRRWRLACLVGCALLCVAVCGVLLVRRWGPLFPRATAPFHWAARTSLQDAAQRQQREPPVHPREGVSVSLVVPLLLRDAAVTEQGAPSLAELLGPLLRSAAALCHDTASTPTHRTPVHAVVVASHATAYVEAAVAALAASGGAAEGGSVTDAGVDEAPLSPAGAWRSWALRADAVQAAVLGASVAADAWCLGEHITLVSHSAGVAVEGPGLAVAAAVETLVDAGLRTEAGRAGTHFVVLASFLAASRMRYTEPDDASEARHEGQGLLAALVSTATTRNGGRVVAAQCTVLENAGDPLWLLPRAAVPYPPPVLTPAALAGMAVLDKGALTGVTHTNETVLPFLARRLSGHPAVDQRAAWEEVVDAATLHCGIFHRAAYDGVGGLAAVRADRAVRETEAALAKARELEQRAHAVVAPDRGGWALSLRMQAAYPAWQVWASRGVAVLREDVAAMRDRYVVSVMHHSMLSLMDAYGVSVHDVLTELQRRRLGVSRRHRHTGADRVQWTAAELPFTPPLIQYYTDFRDPCCGLNREAMGYVRPLTERYGVRVMRDREVCRKPGDALLLMAYGRLDLLWRFPRPRAVADFFAARYGERARINFEHWRAKSYLWSLVGGPRDPVTVTVGRSLSELSNIPESWVVPMRHRIDEVWATADFFATIYKRNGISGTKIRVVPEAVDVYEYDPTNYARQAMALRRHGAVDFDTQPNLTDAERLQRYVFFSNFKWEDRKGWDVLLGAYWDAFGPSAPPEMRGRTTLVVKTKFELAFTRGVTYSNVRRFIEAWGRLGSLPGMQSMEDYPHLIVMGDAVTSAELAQLYANADAFVYPSKAEGWGLPATEAMSMGLPVLVTDWSGLQRFITPDTCFRIPVDALEEISPDSPYGYEDGMKMAEPSREKTAELMRYVVQHPEHARRVGRRAREFAVQELSEEAVADLMDSLLTAAVRRRIKTGNT